MIETEITDFRSVPLQYTASPVKKTLITNRVGELNVRACVKGSYGNYQYSPLKWSGANQLFPFYSPSAEEREKEIRSIAE
jgi:hypothetical protein